MRPIALIGKGVGNLRRVSSPSPISLGCSPDMFCAPDRAVKLVAVTFLLRSFVSLEEFVHLPEHGADRKSTRLNSSHTVISYAVFCLKKKKYRIYGVSDY